MAKLVSLLVKFAALIFVLKLPAPYAIEMQLLGGIWIAQMFPAVAIGVFTRWFHPWALFAGWSVGMVSGSWMVWTLGLKSSVYPVPHVGSMYAAVPALLLNLAVATILTLVLRPTGFAPGVDQTDAAAYIG
jgi:SSS family solute:Na+ symporter